MKKRKWIYAALALTLGLTACTQDDAPDLQEQELRIATRSTATEGTTETFTDDFTLELWSTIDNSKYETHSMTYTEGTGWNTVKSSILPAHAFAYKGSSVTDISYSDNSWNYTVALQTDQSDATKLADADVMIATGSAAVGTQLALNFEHVFAKVTFNYEMASEFTSSDAITACTVKSTSDVLAYVDSGAISAMIAASTYEAGSEFVCITVNQESPLRVLAPEGGLAFEAGKHYTFSLKVGKDKVTLTPTGLDTGYPGGWNNDSEEDLK